MRKKTKHKLAMYQTVIDTVKANDTSWEGIPVFVDTVEKLIEKVTSLEEAEQTQRLATVGVVSSRNTLRNNSTNQLMRISGALSALGKMKGDDVLHLQMKISPSTLKLTSRTEYLSVIASIVNCALQHAEDLAPFGITQNEISDLMELKNNLINSSLRPRAAIIERKGSTIKISTLEKEIDDLLRNELDEIMKLIKASNEDFYRSYKQARSIISYGTRGSSDKPTE